MRISKCDKYLVGTSSAEDIHNLYSKMIEYDEIIVPMPIYVVKKETIIIC